MPNDIPLFQQCRDHSAACKQCNAALTKAAIGYGYGQPKGCVIDSRPAIPEMCAEGVMIYTARHAEMDAETAERMQRVAQGHVSSLETHLEAIKKAVSFDDNKLFSDMVLDVRNILDGTTKIFEEQKPVEVVAAVRRLIRRDGNKYWVCRRTDEGSHGGLAGMWEYPGGKVKEDETHHEALEREMREEFGVEITFVHLEPLAAIITTAVWSETQKYQVSFYAVAFLSEPKFQVHDQAKWCTVEELLEHTFLPSGAEFNRRLAL